MDSARILIVGNGAALGVGVRSHDLALPGALARAVSLSTGIGIDVDLVADARISLLRVVEAVRLSHPDRYDCVVVVTGRDEALGLIPLRTWKTRLSQVMDDLQALIGSATPIIVAGVPANHLARPIPHWIARVADAHAGELNRVSLEVCMSKTNVQFAALDAAPHEGVKRAQVAEEFSRWAQLIAREVASDFSALAPDDVRSGWDERRRQRAVDRLGLTDSGADSRLRHIADLARMAFGTKTALFTVLDRDVQLHSARSGTSITRIARSESFCQYTILERGGMIVGDALTDDRFRHNPLVVGEPYVRFYAGFPVESPDGERIGALCVFDSIPRRVEDVDISLLCELAHLIQRELWRYLPEAAARDSQLLPLSRAWTLPRFAPITRDLGVETRGA